MFCFDEQSLRFKLHKSKDVGTLVQVKRWQTTAIAVAVIAAGLYLYLHWGNLPFGRTRTGASDTSTSSTLAASGHAARMSWQTVNRPDDGFKVEMPADPKDLQVPAYNEAGSTEPVKMLFANPDGDTTFAISWEDNPPVSRVNSRAPDKTLDMARDGMLARTQTSLTSESRLTASGFPARDISAKNTEGGVLDARLIFTGDRLYMLMALFPSNSARREQDVIRFFSSFAPSRVPGGSLPMAAPRS